MTTSDNPEAANSGQMAELTAMVRDLVSMMDDGGIQSLKLEYGDLRLSLKAGSRGETSAPGIVHAQAPPATTALTGPDQHEEPVGHVITAPMIGTFYVAPAPNEPPFVTVGDDVAEGQTIGIVEAMKIMNEIAADRAGTVIEIIAGDGQTVEYGSPLVRIEPAGE